MTVPKTEPSARRLPFRLIILDGIGTLLFMAGVITFFIPELWRYVETLMPINSGKRISTFLIVLGIGLNGLFAYGLIKHIRSQRASKS